MNGGRVEGCFSVALDVLRVFAVRLIIRHVYVDNVEKVNFSLRRARGRARTLLVGTVLEFERRLRVRHCDSRVSECSAGRRLRLVHAKGELHASDCARLGTLTGLSAPLLFNCALTYHISRSILFEVRGLKLHNAPA
jgi:hypothetical protein